MSRTTGGTRGDVRQSALWGSGNRGDELRSNALWGKGGRGLATIIGVMAFAVPLAATAAAGSGAPGAPAAGDVSFVSQQLKDKAKASPDALVQVIVQVDQTSPDAEKAARKLGKYQRKLGLINAFTMELTAKELDKLAKIKGLVVTEDAPVKPVAYSSTQLWPHENGVAKLWNGPKAPTIAFVDSGIDTSKLDFAGRNVTTVNMTSLANNSPGDGRGHGTFVAGIAGGSAPGYAGAAPNADIVMLDVLDDSGMGMTSDVIAAAGWIYENKSAYNIRIANFSLHSGAIGPFYNDPLDRAVEKLWFGGVVVVAAAGNYGTATGPSGVRYAPGNDPFVITVGALDLGGTARIGDDSMAPWSSYGRTYDGFWKPELCASGRYMVGPVPLGSTLAALKADKLVGGGYIELSGTSFATSVVSGVAAQLLARFPALTPDQVKATLMARARAVPQAASGSCGVGQVNAVRAGTLPKDLANPNLALNRFVVAGPDGPAFDAVSWTDVSWTDVSWDSVSWDSVSWSDVSWDSVSWSDVSWDSVSWSDVSWEDVSWEDAAADGDTLDLDGYELTPVEEQAAADDPDLALP
ncbi:MAG: S8 family serine peptidase [Actinobacteria bacterium]|nr:S8 family serine peptidase [Actinomycetota bacterium]